MVQPTPGSVVTPLDGSVMRVTATYRGQLSGTGENWMGPQVPLPPIAPPEVAGRIYDYPFSFNTQVNPRAGEAISFSDLRNLADAYDIIRLIIETRKDQMERRTWEIHPRTQANGEAMADENDPRILTLSKFFEKPDGHHSWNEWSRLLLEEMFVLDAASLYRRRTRGGQLFGLEVIDGSQIKRLIDPWGRTPLPPFPAYQHILKGMQAVNYTTNDLLYCPRNIRAHKAYGYSPVEQVIMSVSIAMRRQLFQLQYYTEGNIPEALVGTPDDWTPEQIGKFQVAFDAMLAGNQALRRRIKFVPSGVAKTFIATKEPDLTGKQDEWLARIACFAFSISPQPFVSMMNRATAQTAHDASIEEGLAPIERWVSSVCNRILEEDFGVTDLEFGWQDDREADPKQQSEVLSKYVEDGILVIDEAREVLGQAPLPDGAGAEARVKTATGYVKISINDDAPTAGEAHQQTQDAAAAQADALAQSGGAGPGGPAAKKPQPKAKPAAAKSAEAADMAPVPFDLRKRRPRPMSHRTAAVSQGERRLSVLLRRALQDLARSASDAALSSLNSDSSHVKLAFHCGHDHGDDELEKTNDNHDDQGRFSSGGGGGAADHGSGDQPEGHGEGATGQHPDISNMSIKELADHLSANKIWLTNEAGDSERTRQVLVAATTTIDSIIAGGGPVAEALTRGGMQPTKLELVKGATVRDEGGLRTFATYSKSDNTITIATGRPLSGTAEKPGIGKDHIGTDFRTVLSHEIGHAGTGKIATAAIKNGFGDKSISEVYASKPKAYWAKTVSAYGSSNYRELVAEAYAAYSHPGYANSKGIAPEMSSWFQAAGVPSGIRKSQDDVLEKVLHSLQKVDKARAAGQAAIDALDYSILVVTAERELERVARDGGQKALISIGVYDDEAIVNLTYDEAAAWAADRAAEMVGKKWVNGKLVNNPNAEFAITDTARDDVRAAVESAINEGLPASELADKISALGVFSEDRAIMIARTEIIRANNEGHMAAFRASGVVEQKEWSTAEDADCCDDCQANADQGPIGLDEEFESGDVAPPLHPNCRCTLVPYIAEADTGDEE